MAWCCSVQGHPDHGIVCRIINRPDCAPDSGPENTDDSDIKGPNYQALLDKEKEINEGDPIPRPVAIFALGVLLAENDYSAEAIDAARYFVGETQKSLIDGLNLWALALTELQRADEADKILARIAQLEELMGE